MYTSWDINNRDKHPKRVYPYVIGHKENPYKKDIAVTKN